MLNLADSEQAVSVLSAAFQDDPTCRWLFNYRSQRYRRRMAKYFRATHEDHMRQQQPALGLWLGGDLVGVAYLRRDRAGLSYRGRLMVLLCTLEGGCLFRAALYKKRVQSRYPSGPSHFLSLLAVQPSHQGRGYGRALLNAAHALADNDAASGGIILETANPRNIPFYEAAGYRTVDTVSVGNVVQTLMERAPAVQPAGV